jgi:hypothetical protein
MRYRVNADLRSIAENFPITSGNCRGHSPIYYGATGRYHYHREQLQYLAAGEYSLFGRFPRQRV